jgi:hypothetical protein
MTDLERRILSECVIAGGWLDVIRYPIVLGDSLVEVFQVGLVVARLHDHGYIAIRNAVEIRATAKGRKAIRK